MSSKNLLNENTVRRFMKLASIQPLSSKFINENYPLQEAPEDELPPEEEAAGASLEGEEAMSDEGGMSGEEEMDLGDDFGAEEPGVADMSLTEEEAQVLIDLGKRLEEALDEEGGEEALGDVADVPEEPADEDALAVAGEEEEEEEEPAAPIAENLVNEVLKRVTKRIIKERLKG